MENIYRLYGYIIEYHKVGKNSKWIQYETKRIYDTELMANDALSHLKPIRLGDNTIEFRIVPLYTNIN